LALYPDRAQEVPVSKIGGKLTVDATPARPIIVFRDGDAARTKMSAQR